MPVLKFDWMAPAGSRRVGKTATGRRSLRLDRVAHVAAQPVKQKAPPSTTNAVAKG